MPVTATCSGPKPTRATAIEALSAAGFTIEMVTCRCHKEGEHNWGHPSYPNTETAKKAGKPLAGHTPGTKHPESGKDYAPDPRVSFLTVVGTSEDREGQSAELGRIISLLEPIGWALRGHWTRVRPVDTARQSGLLVPGDDLSYAERMARVEADLAILKEASR